MSVKGVVDLSQMATIFLPSTGYSAGGTLKIDGLVTGDIPDINPTLRLSVQGGTFRAPELAEPVQQVGLDVSLANGALSVKQLSAQLGPGTLDVKGNVPLGILPVGLPASIPRSQGSADLRGTHFQLLPPIHLRIAGGRDRQFDGQPSSAVGQYGP